MTLAEFAPEWIRRSSARWKPSTVHVTESYLRNQILPGLGAEQVATLDGAAVRRWFAALRHRPAAANRSLPIVSGMLRSAVEWGIRDAASASPCAGIRRYRVPRRERFLAPGEYCALGAALRRFGDRPQARLISVLALTGARQGELRGLRWSEVAHNALHLEDSKTGPRTVWLCAAAARLVQAADHRGDFVFGGQRPMSNGSLHHAWYAIREDADLPGVRLHDLRHSYASRGMVRGHNTAVVGRLLGHSSAETTLRYQHHHDAEGERALAALEFAA